jgi:hypothetical protein
VDLSIESCYKNDMMQQYDGFILIYWTDSKETLTCAEQFGKQIKRQFSDGPIPAVLVGNRWADNKNDIWSGGYEASVRLGCPHYPLQVIAPELRGTLVRAVEETVRLRSAQKKSIRSTRPSCKRSRLALPWRIPCNW